MHVAGTLPFPQVNKNFAFNLDWLKLKKTSPGIEILGCEPQISRFEARLG